MAAMVLQVLVIFKLQNQINELHAGLCHVAKVSNEVIVICRRLVMTHFGPWPALCKEVHDGDTVVFDIDLGFGVRLPGQDWDGKTELSCRLVGPDGMGVNAPELWTAEGKDALAFALTILHPGDRCQVTSHKWDKYGGRYDGQITLPDGTDFATLMVEAGHAVWKKY